MPKQSGRARGTKGYVVPKSEYNKEAKAGENVLGLDFHKLDFAKRGVVLGLEACAP